MLNHRLQSFAPQKEQRILRHIFSLLNLWLCHLRLIRILQRFLNLTDTQIFLLLRNHFLGLQRILQVFHTQRDVVFQVFFQFFVYLVVNLLDILRQLLLRTFRCFTNIRHRQW